MNIDNNNNITNNNNIIIQKKYHSPLDEAMFISLNSLILGLTFSFSLFHKSLPYHSLPLKSKLGIIFRNTSTMVLCIFISKYVEKSINKKENKALLKKFYFNDKSIFLLENILSTIIPFLIGYNYYFFRNKYPSIEKSSAFILALSSFVVDLIKI
jgi:hypothetical protein